MSQVVLYSKCMQIISEIMTRFLLCVQDICMVGWLWYISELIVVGKMWGFG